MIKIDYFVSNRTLNIPSLNLKTKHHIIH
jgi:hypothetical protein